jgi:hypothetical protein
MTNEELNRQYAERAAAERAAGGSIEINEGIPYVAIKLSDGAEYFFQEWQADDLLATVPDWAHREDYLLAQAQNW